MAKREHPAVETWIHIWREVIHHVVPSRKRTVHLLWIITIPPAALGGMFAVLFSVLIPDPGRWIGVAGCGVGVLLVARLRTSLLRLLLRRTERARSAAQALARGPDGGSTESAEPAPEEGLPTTRLLP
ncbi:hypothetical protein [Streptomyces fructofermentans]|uniref:Uncharacterized protein n=1 Tax=Streptomyces fructofermentans TaxID=152141 RepID=A0A918NUH3_9ACTN|nr:hypothetical protein [Streptomyces fructofermentans]GGX97530.1 hypothetical protein GCM10010515_74960 [Streptomyces fructofermentans]